MDVSYLVEPHLSPAEFAAVLRASGLAARRPVDDPERLAAMLQHASLIITARVGEALVGVSRALTDFAYCTYLSDLAVDRSVQRCGIGRTLIEKTHDAAGRQTSLILLAAPDAESYYGHVGMQRHGACWVSPRTR